MNHDGETAFSFLSVRNMIMDKL